MHVHTVHSGMCTVPLVKLICRESYSQPQAVYEALKRQGMDLVTITDHDSIDAVEPLRRHPDFFLSEELTCRLPSGTELHVGVYDITEQQHIQMKRRRDDFPALVAYLREQRLFFTANHVFSSLTGRRASSDFEWIATVFPALETLNGCMPAAGNAGASALARKLGKIAVAGSDAHTLHSAGTCWTDVPGARTKSEFFAGLRGGAGRVAGTSGNYWRLTADIFRIGGGMVLDNPLTALPALLGVAIPAVTLVNYLMEAFFSRMWIRRTAAAPMASPRGIIEEVAA